MPLTDHRSGPRKVPSPQAKARPFEGREEIRGGRTEAAEIEQAEPVQLLVKPLLLGIPTLAASHVPRLEIKNRRVRVVLVVEVVDALLPQVYFDSSCE